MFFALALGASVAVLALALASFLAIVAVFPLGVRVVVGSRISALPSYFAVVALRLALAFATLPLPSVSLLALALRGNTALSFP